MARRLLMVALVAAVAAAAAFPLVRRGHRGMPPELPVSFPRSGLVTNEHAHFDPSDRASVRSPLWDVSSGSLFGRDGLGWSGVPDARSPGPRSLPATGSAVFRATLRPPFEDAVVRCRVRVLRFVTTPRTPARSWDGVHLFLRWQSPQELYAVSVVRRDGLVLVKKKLPGGPSNGGTYTTLGPPARAPLGAGAWRRVAVEIRTLASGSVAIDLRLDGRTVLSVEDTGQGGAPIRAAGRVGIRGDNAEFEIADLRVSRLP